MTQDFIGLFGAGLLAICAIPQALDSWYKGKTEGINDVFLVSWYLGEIIMLYYVHTYISSDNALFYNYLVNTLAVSVIVRYRYFPRS